MIRPIESVYSPVRPPAINPHPAPIKVQVARAAIGVFNRYNSLLGTARASYIEFDKYGELQLIVHPVNVRDRRVPRTFEGLPVRIEAAPAKTPKNARDIQHLMWTLHAPVINAPAAIDLLRDFLKGEYNRPLNVQVTSGLVNDRLSLIISGPDAKKREGELPTQYAGWQIVVR